LAQAQTEFYVTEIAKWQSFPPFAFMTNGHDIHFWDGGQANPRLVRGFFSPLDLENLLYLCQNKTPLPSNENSPRSSKNTNVSTPSSGSRRGRGSICSSRCCIGHFGEKYRWQIFDASGTLGISAGGRITMHINRHLSVCCGI